MPRCTSPDGTDRPQVGVRRRHEHVHPPQKVVRRDAIFEPELLEQPALILQLPPHHCAAPLPINQPPESRFAGLLKPRILRGASPGDLPVDEASKFDFVVGRRLRLLRTTRCRDVGGTGAAVTAVPGPRAHLFHLLRGPLGADLSRGELCHLLRYGADGRGQRIQR